MENLKELFKHPGWVEYVDVIEGEMVALFMELFQLEPSKAENFVRFVELKSRIDQLRNITYFIERQVTDDIGAVDASYGQRFMALLKKIWRS